jgi:hypothetical protein
MKRLWVIASAAVVLLLGCLVSHLSRPKEPSLGGKTLTAWLQVYTDERSSRDHDYDAELIHTEAENAIHNFGTNAIPTLLQLLEAHDSKLKLKLVALLRRQRFIKFHFLDAHEEHMLAFHGFVAIGADGRPAAASLVNLTRYSDPDVQLYALMCLGNLNLDNGFYRPVLTRLLKDPDEGIRHVAAESISLYLPQEAERAGVYEMFPELRPSGTNSVPTNSPAAK